MSHGVADRYWLPDDLLELPDDGNRYEIVDGKLRVSPSPPWRHQTAGFRLGVQLEAAVPVGLSVVVPAGGVVTNRAYLIPDLAVVESALATDADHKGDPARIRLVAEVQSKSSAIDDVREKAELYAEAGIPSYWRVEFQPELALVVMELSDGAYVEVARGRRVTVERPFPVTLDLTS